MQKSKPESSKTCAGSKNAKNAQIQTNQALTSDIASGFCSSCIVLSLCRFWSVQVWIFCICLSLCMFERVGGIQGQTNFE